MTVTADIAAKAGGLQATIILHPSVHRQVADGLGMQIVRGDIAPGDALPSEQRVCEMLGVSRTVVREAIRVLAGKGLLTSRARSGTRVRPPEEWNQLDPDVLRWQMETTDDDRYLVKLLQLRRAVEPSAAALAATAATEDDLAQLRAAFDGMEAARDNDAFVTADIAFRKTIYIATRNEFFWPLAQMFAVTLRRSFAIAATGDHRARGIEDHRKVVEAVTDRAPDRAWQTTMELLGNATEDLVRIRGVNPFATESATPSLEK